MCNFEVIWINDSDQKVKIMQKEMRKGDSISIK